MEGTVYVFTLLRLKIHRASSVTHSHLHGLNQRQVLQCSDGLSNKVPNIIRRLMDNMKFLLICILRVLLSHSFTFFGFYFLSIYIWFYSCLII